MSEANARTWDQEVDLLIVGSGAGAMTASVVATDRGASALVIEKTDRYGGSSAMSGGGLWVPNNHLMDETPVDDSPEDAWAYLASVTEGRVPEERLRAYLDTAPNTVRWLMEHTHIDMEPLPAYGDYYPLAPGAKPGGRALDPKKFDARFLGEDFLSLRDQNPQMLIMGRIFMTIFEARTLLTRGPGWIWLTMRLMFKYMFDIPWRFRSKRDRSLAMGNALVGMLRRSMLDRDIPLWLDTAARELIVEDGRVVGLLAEREGREIRIRAHKGVILAAGGFEGNQQMRDKFLPNPTRVEWTCANPNNTGDAIRMGLDIGASLDLMEEAWWGPVTVVPGEPHARMLVIEKSLPGSVLVNRAGLRFVNEAATYTDVVNAMYASNKPEVPSIPAWLVFDADYRAKYPCGPMLQSQQQPDWALPAAYRKGYLKKSNSLEGLAKQMGVDAAGLAQTVAKMNEYAATGKDLDFHRGETASEQYYGDENMKPNPNLGPIAKAPFYAIETFPGELGTKGGLRTNDKAQVLREGGGVIEGLYAIGNCSASVMGHTYPGAGATLGPATTFGYIAARHATPA
jgi:3-oxosteroid 1-dehydrogenase